jgi:hypothetical protein
MAAFIWLGFPLALGGLAGLLWCIREARRLKAPGVTEAEARTRLRLLVLVNTAAFGTGFLGAGMVLAGFLLQG